MKGRSHRLPISEPPDDWGDGSWTVDCVCGVNFDDGEEMVNCDECGVWVHTRCSRFVKGETSFACDKCKSKKNRNDSEETEVAQLLVELPTKTMRMDNPYPASAPPRTSFRLWTEIPIEERVHVQGVPGGDPALFQGLSSVFTPELWKCTGYVPKKLNFQYREFPCWDEKQDVDARAEEENENPVDRGAGVLFSLSKELVSVTPVETFIGWRGSREGAGYERKQSPKETKKREGKDSVFGRMHNGVKREKNQLQPSGVHSGKRKKDDVGSSKDRSGKRKARTADKEADNKKRVYTPAIDAQKLEFHEDGGSKAVKDDSQDAKNDDKRETVFHESDSHACLEAINNMNKPMNVSTAKSHSAGDISNDASGDIAPIETVQKAEKVDTQIPPKNLSSPKTVANAASHSETTYVSSIPVKEEDANVVVDHLDHINGDYHDPRDLNGGSSNAAMDFQKPKHLLGDSSVAALQVPDNQMLQDSNCGMSLLSMAPDSKVKEEADDGHLRKDSDLLLSSSDTKADPIKVLSQHPARCTSEQTSEKLPVQGIDRINLPTSDTKVQDTNRESEAVSHHDTDKVAEGTISASGELCQGTQELEGSVQEGSFDTKDGPKHGEEPSKIDEANPSSLMSSSQRKVIAGHGKSSTSSTVKISKPSLSGGSKPPARDETSHEASRKMAKDQNKVSTSSGAKTSQTSRISHSSVAKRTLSDSHLQSKIAASTSSQKGEKFNQSTSQPTSKVNHSLSTHPPTPANPSATLSDEEGAAVASGTSESASSFQTQGGALHVQSKITASVSSQKGEKFNQSTSQPTSKMNHTPLMHPPAPVNPSATLSDEELALLLHQELNSSPRVPRVPRVRHAGSIPQLASRTPTSMLNKRTSSSGGKDQTSVSRRKNKEDASKDNSRNSRELGDETKKMEKVPSSPDQRRQDQVSAADGSNKREASNKSSEVLQSTKKTMHLATSTVSNGGPSSSTDVNDQNLSSIRNSPRDMSDDDTSTIGGPAPRTLPGLIDEIMSKGRRMTYEELCNVVLPHWHSLRKHNGERYAYSSHSQAVLDCLRNRNEWAQLVDRGPKTNAGRKKRKLDSEASMAESEENEYGKGRTKDIEGRSVDSQREDFPKGKRKARKRRRLALQGRGIKDVRKRQKADAITDDDIGQFSHSSEEGTENMFSEDESQGARMCAIGSEASTSSDETGPT
ncbi:PREDICTED: uncharacterized protein LOC104599711 isoform X2 [Nelumbo nucifera]|uniref:Uncharacterized protein LOC104599711 isoform X2 n=2 Tax=Nelumbo nucifera TaxID=4432 RepID=A0A1U8A138_NELNU|nr:PREDICTED: uncharacterized protein LOC104599711 isoform X2 [Nelumbo nucifera]DAD44019.1 TPA_asm: hypothetical protein HUJ06_002249 [Nelumbo nucifera]